MLADWYAQLVSLLQVAIAGGLGGAIGLERELAGKPAGLRTHMLVAASATLQMLVGESVVASATGRGSSEIADPTRVVHAVILGVSFLGAGTIIGHRDEPRVEGLTTAGSVLLVAVIGLAVGAGRVVLAVGVTALALVVLRGLGRFETWMARKQGKT